MVMRIFSEFSAEFAGKKTEWPDLSERTASYHLVQLDETTSSHVIAEIKKGGVTVGAALSAANILATLAHQRPNGGEVSHVTPVRSVNIMSNVSSFWQI